MATRFQPTRGSSALGVIASRPGEPTGEAFGITQESTDFTFSLDHMGYIVESTKATGMTGTVPPNSSVAFPVKTRIDVVQYGAGQFSIAAGAGVTIRSAGAALDLRDRYSGATLYQRATDEWVLLGDLAV